MAVSFVPERDEPVLGDQPFKLAVFGVNVSHGCSMSTAEGHIVADWEESVELTLAAERAGFDAMVPVARWKGFGGKTNFGHRSFETYAWATGLAAKTEKIHIFSTSHVPTIHPILAAKQAATIDHISNGRFGLNIVAGWNFPEINMFGTKQREHDERYKVAAEWISLIKQLWTLDGFFDFEGEFFAAKDCYAEPKPVQDPHPIVMSAGHSDAGRRFAMTHADLLFAATSDPETTPDLVKEIKKAAAKEYNRDLPIYGMASIVCRDTEDDAKRYFEYYVKEKGDRDAAGNMLSVYMGNSQGHVGFDIEPLKDLMISGYGAMPQVGTAEQVVEGLAAMKDMGLDGVSISWLDYAEGISQYDEILRPLMIEAGLRNA